MRIERARAKAQLAKLPESQVADTTLGATVVLDVDATLVTAHSEKQFAAGTFTGGFGYHLSAAWCDNTQEMLAVERGRVTPARKPSPTTSTRSPVALPRFRLPIASTC
jgi:hypothetical protein